MRHILGIIFSIIFLVPLSAQEKGATPLLDKAIEQLQSTKGVTLSFTISANGDTGIGKIALQGNRFVLELPDMKIWFDGKTQWTLMESAGEVNISTPEPEELIHTNPYMLLQSYKKNFSCLSATEEGDLYRYQLASKEDSEIKHINIIINKATKRIERLIVESQDGNKTDITITDFAIGNFTEKHFVFDANKYPDIEIIDLR